MIPNSQKVNLSYIYEISDGDREFIKEMLKTFLKITPTALEEIEAAQKDKNWKEVGRVAHKVKPTIMLLGDLELSTKIKVLEHDAKQSIDIELLPSKITDIKDQCMETISEIEHLLSTDTY